MNREKKKTYIHIAILIGIVLVFAVAFVGTDYIYGSKVDWWNQHAVFPDYFRKLFYQTGNLFPDFALAIGGGQNIYNFGYYGLLNPVILLSYLFPFIKMIDYIMLSNVLLLMAGAVMCYFFLKRHVEKPGFALLGSLLYLFASPIFFHSHHHIMFVNYMPFLFLSLLGVDLYFEKKKRTPLIFGIFLMILMSYYYSVGGLLAIVLYGIYVYLDKESKVTIRSFLLEGVQFLVPVFLGIGLASVLLLPTIYVILHSRGSEHDTFSLLQLLKPNLDMTSLLYRTYAVGVTGISLFALLGFPFRKKKADWFLTVALLLIITLPVFQFLLNGGLYLRAKVLIPFVPLFIYIVPVFLERLTKGELNVRRYAMVLVVAALVLMYFGIHRGYLLETGAFLLCLFLLRKYHVVFPIYLLTLGVACSVMFGNNLGEDFATKKMYHEKYDSSLTEEIEEVLETDPSFYRFGNQLDPNGNFNRIYTDRYYTTSLYSSTYHDDYKEFTDKVVEGAWPHRNILNTATVNNVLFSMFMNHKYVIADTAPVGYQKVSAHIYKNEDVLPFAYATNSFVSEEEFSKLSYPYNLESLLYRTVVMNPARSSSFSSHLVPYEGKLQLVEQEDVLKVNQEGEKITVEASASGKMKFRLPEKLENQILLVSFDLSNRQNCSVGDQSITINDIRNKLTCKQWTYYNGNTYFAYVLSANDGIDSLEVTFAKGKYEIENLVLYTLDYEQIRSVSRTVDAVSIDSEKSIGNVLEGTITTNKEDALLVTSLPYDESFQVYVDGKEQVYEKVNTAFLGFPIEKGKHTIKIVYHAPLKDAGLWISSGCLGVTLIFCALEWKKRNKHLPV